MLKHAHSVIITVQNLHVAAEMTEPGRSSAMFCNVIYAALLRTNISKAGRRLVKIV
jgi:hypothetical protein